MINPKIFHYFKKALKWEIIIICASFAYIMPWHSAHSATTSTWNGRYMMLPDTDRANQLCADEGLSFYPGSNLSCRTNGAYGSSSARYINGYRFHYQSQPVSDRDIDDENGNPLYEGGIPTTPPPDIESCTLTELSAPGATSIPTLTRIDGCIYEFQGVGICTSSTCHWEVTPSGTYSPGEFPECTESQPCPVPGSGESSPGTSQQQDEQIAFIDDILNTNGDTFGRPNGDIVWTHNPPGCDIVITIKPDGTRSDSFEGDQCQVWQDAYNNPHSNPDDPDGDCAGLPCDGDGGTGGDGGDGGDDGDGGTGGNTGGGTGGDGGDGTGGDGTGGNTGGGTGGDGGDGTGGDGTGGDGTGGDGTGGDGSGDGSGNGNGDGNGDGSGDGNGDGSGEFCEYAQVVCDFIDWMTGDEEQPEVPDLPIEELDASDMQVDWDSGLGAGSCPANPQAELMGLTIEYDMTVYCQVASDVVYWLLIFSATIAAGFIIAGLRG